MTPSRLRDCMILIDRSERELARRLQRPESDIRRWLAGRIPVPRDVAVWIETMAAVAERHPAPRPAAFRRPARETHLAG